MYKKIAYRYNVVSQLNKYTKGVRRYFVLLFIFNISSMFISLLVPKVFKIFVNNIIIKKDIKLMNYVVVSYLILGLTSILLNYCSTFCRNILVNTGIYNVKSKIIKGFFYLRYNKNDNQIDDLKMKLDDDIEKLTSFSEAQTINYIVSFIKLLITSILLIYIEWHLALLAVIFIPLTIYLDHIISRKEKDLNEVIRVNNQNMSTWIRVTVQGWNEVKTLNLDKYQKRHFVQYIHQLAKYNARWINFWVSRVLIIPRIKNEFIMKFGVYFVGGLLISTNKITIGSLLIFVMYFEIMTKALVDLSTCDSELQTMMPYIDRILLELKSTQVIEHDKINIESINGITFKDVCFRYNEEDPYIINKFNLELVKGDRLAVTGASGCGKSTLLKLLLGLEVPTEGNIMFSDYNLNDIEVDSIYNKICCVLQDNILFNTSIKENLLYGKPDASDSEIEESCRKAYILDYINSLPEGFNTIIGEKGVKLSGGQRQRIVLARGFLSDVEMYVFDEATSALDQYSESIIHDTIKAISSDKIIIIVSHRESSLKLCNRRINLA